MKATKFEEQHQALLHLLLVGLAALSYLQDRTDIVWAIVRNHSDPASWERLVFGVGALMLIVSAALETWANAHNEVPVDGKASAVGVQAERGFYGRQAGIARILLVLAVGLLLPLSGTMILLIGETILMLRLFYRSHDGAHALVPVGSTKAGWRSGFRVAATKWGLTASMIAFVWTLQDRIAEVGAAGSVVLGLVLNGRARHR